MMEETTTIKRSREETKMNITTVGLDLAKNVFHVICVDVNGKEARKRMLRRNQVRQFFAQLPPCCVAMEACGGSHYWGRELQTLGHTVKLIPSIRQTVPAGEQERL